MGKGRNIQYIENLLSFSNDLKTHLLSYLANFALFETF